MVSLCKHDQLNEVSNKSGLTETTTTVELSKGTAYSWQIISKNK
jgi:hypothetical protein